MSSPQEQFTELTRRTQEGFKNLWQQWSDKGTELMKGATTTRSHTTAAVGNPEEVLDAVFDFAEHLIAQQRIFAKQMLAAASNPQSAIQSGATGSPPVGTSAVDTDRPRSTTTATSGAATTATPPPVDQ